MSRKRIRSGYWSLAVLTSLCGLLAVQDASAAKTRPKVAYLNPPSARVSVPYGPYDFTFVNTDNPNERCPTPMEVKTIDGLPPGLNFDPTPLRDGARLAGTPRTAGTYLFRFTAQGPDPELACGTLTRFETMVTVAEAPPIMVVPATNNQIAAVNTTVVLRAQVVDPQTRAGIPNVAVVWTVTQGNGTLQSLTGTTGAGGVVENSYTTGPAPVDNTVQVSVLNSAATAASFTVLSQAGHVETPAKQLMGPMARAALTGTIQQFSNIYQHLDYLRLLRNPTVLQGTRLTYNGQSLPPMSALALAPTTDKDGKPVAQTGGGAAADKDPFERWGVFVQGDLDVGKLDTTSAQPGFDIRTKGLTIGTDYRFVNNNVIGFSAGFVKANTDLDSNAGNQDAKGWSVSLFGEFVPAENAYVDVVLNYGSNKYDTTRRAVDSSLAGSPTFEYTSNPRGHQFGISLSGGYQFYHQGFTLIPYGRAEYIEATIDAFHESGSGSGGLSLGSQKYKNTILTLGGQVQYAWNQSWGVLVPYGRLEYQYAAQESARQVDVQLVVPPSGGNPIIAVGLPGTDKSYGNASVGISAIWPYGLSGSFNYEYVFGKDNFDNSRYTLSVRYAF